MIDLKRNAGQGIPTSPKRASYTEVPLSDTDYRGTSRSSKAGQGWYTTDSLKSSRTRSNSPQKGNYEPLEQPYDSPDEGISQHPSPLRANPAKSFAKGTNYQQKRASDLSQVSNGKSEKPFIPRALTPGTPSGKRYGNLNPGSSTTIVGGKSNRQASSGNDYSKQGNSGAAKGRRGVSGKVAEEGLAGKGATKYWGRKVQQS